MEKNKKQKEGEKKSLKVTEYPLISSRNNKGAYLFSPLDRFSSRSGLVSI